MQTHKLKAIVLSTMAALSISMMAFFVKLASPYASSNFIVFFRYGFAFLYIMTVVNLKRKGKMVIFPKTQHLGLHLVRGLSAVLSMLLLYYALQYIPLVNANLLFMTNGLFVPIFGHFFFKYKTNIKTWIGIIIAFSGVVFILHPGLHSFHIASIIALISGASGAITYLSVRELVKYDSPHAVMAYSITIAFLFGCVLLLFPFKVSGSHTILLLLGVALFGILYQECFIRAKQYASARTVTALLYPSIIFSSLLGWFVFEEAITAWSWIGFALVGIGTLVLLIYSSE
jgi:drug/metabolite transporter (DMT)-like permease